MKILDLRSLELEVCRLETVTLFIYKYLLSFLVQFRRKVCMYSVCRILVLCRKAALLCCYAKFSNVYEGTRPAHLSTSPVSCTL